jgi:DNA-binding GntR family transcriptional regulator
VREALVRAESSGLVVRQALKGYQVAPLLPPEEFERLMEMRLLIEPYCAARATERADANLLAVLEQQHEAMEHSPTGPTSREYREYMRADVAFHETIAAASGNHFLQTALSATNTHAHRFRRFSGTVSDAPDAIHEHLDVLNAIRAHDPERASAAMRTHLEGVAERGRVTN